MNVTINGKDAKKTWGIVFDSSAISALMMFCPMKPYIKNKSRTEHGERVVTNEQLAKVDARQINLTFSLYANTNNDFFIKLKSFRDEIQKTGWLYIILDIEPDVQYKLLYDSCPQFTQFNNKLAKFGLKCEEPNPKDRSVE